VGVVDEKAVRAARAQPVIFLDATTLPKETNPADMLHAKLWIQLCEVKEVVFSWVVHELFGIITWNSSYVAGADVNGTSYADWITKRVCRLRIRSSAINSLLPHRTQNYPRDGSANLLCYYHR
jgi:hypothetical protein